MKPELCRFLSCCRWCALIFFAALSLRAAVYDFALGDSLNRKLRLNIPDGVGVIRGVLLYPNPSGRDELIHATDAELVAFAGSLNFAVVASAYWGSLSTASELASWDSGFQQLANKSGHPELVRAPVISYGFSNGGQVSYQLAVARPERMIAFASTKGGGYVPTRPDTAVLKTPGLHVAGQIDNPDYGAATRDLFFGNRPRGALWAWSEEEGQPHVWGDVEEVFLPYLETMVRLRYPANASPVFGTVSLTPANETSGWLFDSASFTRGLADIASSDTYGGDRSSAGWLPDRRMAYIFRAFASYHKATYQAVLSSGTGPVAWGTPVTYEIGAPARAWSAVDFFNGDVLLQRITPADHRRLAVDSILTNPGYSVFHALVTFVDGSQATTIPRRVFTVTPAALASAGNTSLSVGGTTTLTAAPPANGQASVRWQSNSGTGWRDLADGASNSFGSTIFSGATTASLTIDNASAGMDGVQLRALFTNGSTVASSATLSLAVADLPVLAIKQPSPVAVTAGTSVTLEVQGSGGNLRYLWFRDGVEAYDLVGSSVTFFAGAADQGNYSVVATDSSGRSASANLGTLLVTSDAKLVNLSARAYVQSGDNVLIAGFVTIGANSGGSKSVLLRGAGPTLGVPGSLPGVQLRLFNSSGAAIDSNSGWNANLNPVFSRLGAFPFVAGSRDAALLESMPGGAYTAQVSPLDLQSGVGLVEIYDADDGVSNPRLANLSARANVGTGDNLLIGGFVITGPTAETVLIRAVGPTLGEPPFNLSGVLSYPVLTVFDAQGKIVAKNKGWNNTLTIGTSEVSAGMRSASALLMSAVGAFPFTPGSADSALVLSLPPGAYTAQVNGFNALTGIGLVEIYELR
ncbi:MAG TPA: hypothetical protein VHD76_14645 [Bryobacteraceae bacterium]|nr:hypothetical protein [Bryobacteraceae bacterium]